ncbi:hypothetical protein Tco_1353078 [Tanacetum coccineum]
MPTEMELTLEQTQQGVSYEVSFDESNANVLERFYTSARNPVKEILLKLNLPDHRILKDGGEGEESPIYAYKIKLQSLLVAKSLPYHEVPSTDLESSLFSSYSFKCIIVKVSRMCREKLVIRKLGFQVYVVRGKLEDHQNDHGISTSYSGSRHLKNITSLKRPVLRVPLKSWNRPAEGTELTVTGV